MTSVDPAALLDQLLVTVKRRADQLEQTKELTPEQDGVLQGYIRALAGLVKGRQRGVEEEDWETMVEKLKAEPLLQDALREKP